jgi:hypothetical protein
MLRDAAHIAESDAAYVNRHHPGEDSTSCAGLSW